MKTSSTAIRILPSVLPPAALAESLATENNWFYSFVFSGGVKTQASSPLAHTFHITRAELIFPLLDQVFQGAWQEIRCLDLACHQGWYAAQVAVRGAGEVLGLDIRDEHIRMASLIRNVSGMDNLLFRMGDLYAVNPAHYGIFDLTLFLGILYHLDNPIGALRTARSLTSRLCVLETQVARTAPVLHSAWGSSGEMRQGPGIAVLPADDAHAKGTSDVVLVPTLDALTRMLYAVGFDRLYVVFPPPDAHEQFASLDRVIVFAQVTQ